MIETIPYLELSLDQLITSDTHFGHNNVITYCNRPFKDSDHMDTVMVDNWNNIVDQNTKILHLGDWCFRGTGHKQTIQSRLNGYKIIVKGNHDPSRLQLVQKFGFQEAYREIEGKIVETGQTFYMCHIPNTEKAKQYDLHFCGHVHLLFVQSGNIINVGADHWDYKPQTLRTILAQAASRQNKCPVQLNASESLDARDLGIQQRLMGEKE